MPFLKGSIIFIEPISGGYMIKHQLSLQFLLHLIFSLAILNTAGAAENDDIVYRGQAPKWHSNSPTSEISALCKSETDLKEKYQVCAFLMKRYSTAALSEFSTDAQEQARSLLQIIKQNKEKVEYSFGAHDSHQTLGRIALLKNDLKTAKEELIKSIEVSLDPALKTVGPKMILAQELLEKGEKEIVLKYLDRIQKFWKAQGAQEEINRWKTEIKEGKIPKFKTY